MPPAPAGDVISRGLFDSPAVSAGLFRCPREHRVWKTTNTIGTVWPLVVFPRVPVWIRHAAQPRVLADANRIMFYNPRTEYERALVAERGDECEWIAIRPDLVAAELERLGAPVGADASRPLRFAQGPSSAALYLRQRAVLDSLISMPAEQEDAAALEEALLALAGHAIELAVRACSPASARRRSTAEAHQEIVESAKRAIAERPCAPVDIEEVARRVHASPFHLCRVFKAGTGCGMAEYAMSLRLRASLEPLADGVSDLTRLALDLGFSSHAHFTTAFRRVFGAPPSRVRARLVAPIVNEQNSESG